MKKSVTNRIIKYSLNEKKNLAIGMVFTVLMTVFEIIGPIILAYIINNLLTGEKLVYNIRKLALVLCLYAVVFFVDSLWKYNSTVYLEKTANKIARRMQMDVYDHIQKMPISFYDNLPAGKVVSRITNDTKTVKSFYQMVLAQLMVSVIVSIFMIAMVLITDTKIGIIVCLFFPIMFYIFRKFLQKSRFAFTNMRKYISEENAKINETIGNIEIIKAFNLEDDFSKDYEISAKNVYDYGYMVTKAYGTMSYNVSELLRNFANITILGLYAYNVLTGNTDVKLGSMYLTMEYTTRTFSYISNCVQRMGSLEQSFSAAEHVFELLDTEVEEFPEREIGDIKGDVKFENVDFSYIENEPVLKDLSLDIKSGESVAFVGFTGSGKTTIINLLLGFYKPQRGVIKIDGKNFNDYSVDSIRKNISLVPQDPVLFMGDVKSNIRLDKDFTDEEVENALRDIGADKLIDFRNGIDEEVKGNGASFSAGEKQLIAFARSYITNPKILILDEATANIDTQTESVIQYAIDKLKQNRTTLIIAHRLSTIKNVDCIYVLDKGVIVEKGTHEELLANGKIYTRMYREQNKKG